MKNIDTRPACADLFLNAILPEEEARIRRALLGGASSLIRRLGNQIEAEVISKGFLNLMEHCRRGGEVKNLEAFAARIGKNIALDWLDRQRTADRNRPGYTASRVQPAASPEEELGGRQVLFGALASLSEKSRRDLLRDKANATAAERKGKQRARERFSKAAKDLGG